MRKMKHREAECLVLACTANIYLSCLALELSLNKTKDTDSLSYQFTIRTQYCQAESLLNLKGLVMTSQGWEFSWTSGSKAALSHPGRGGALQGLCLPL